MTRSASLPARRSPLPFLLLIGFLIASAILLLAPPSGSAWTTNQGQLGEDTFGDSIRYPRADCGDNWNLSLWLDPNMRDFCLKGSVSRKVVQQMVDAEEGDAHAASLDVEGLGKIPHGGSIGSLDEVLHAFEQWFERFYWFRNGG